MELYFLITGRSGCKIYFDSTNQISTVKKESGSLDYNSRLNNQVLKHKIFYEEKILSNSKFKAPRILGKSADFGTGLYWYEMEYIPGESYGTFIERCSINELKTLAENIITFIDSEIKRTEESFISDELIRGKIDQLKLRLAAKEILNKTLEKLLNNLMRDAKDLILPIGFCHGDLTFSNMIFNNSNIYLVDFLDSFIESPLIDIVKIRQDTKFFWTLFIDKNKNTLQTGKIIQAFRYLDKRIEEHFWQYEFYKENYNFFESLNLLRILPYLTDKQEIQFIIDCLNIKDK